MKRTILIVQGTTDIQVPIIHADLLAEANPKSEKKIRKIEFSLSHNAPHAPQKQWNFEYSPFP